MSKIPEVPEESKKKQRRFFKTLKSEPSKPFELTQEYIDEEVKRWGMGSLRRAVKFIFGKELSKKEKKSDT